jgi:uncharacterized protein
MSAHPDAGHDSGRVALQRGPIVYCLEEADNPVPLQRIVLPSNIRFTSHFDSALLGGVTVINGKALAASVSDWDKGLYRNVKPKMKPCTLTAIPYYAWDNRKPGQMRVWFPVK